MPLTEQEKENVRATYDDSEVDNGAYDAYGPNVTNEMLVEQPEFIDENPPGESYWDDENTAEFHEYMNYVDEDTGNDRRFWGPEQVARYSNFIASQGDEYVDNGLLDVPGITAANDAYVRANPGKSWDQWSDNDETIALTTNLKTPPSEAVPEWDKKQATWSVVDEGMKQKGFTVQSAAEIPQNVREQYIKDQPAETLGTDKFYLPQNIAPKTGTEVMQPGELTPQKVGAMVAGMPEEQFNQLEPWKQWVLPFMTEFPILASTAMGAAAGAKLGPLGTVAGATAGGAMGWLQTQTNPDGSYKYPGLIDIFNKLDLPAEFLERAQGFAGMVISSLTDPKKYGPIGEVLNNLPESWDAAHLTYDVSFAPIGAVKDGKLYSDELNKPGQNVYELTPEQQDSALSSTMLTEARRRLVAGEAANDVYADIKSRFGFRGDTQDLLGHMVVDPLNVLPEATTKGIGKAAELTGHGTLAKATEMAGGPVSVIQEYSRIARTELDANQRAALAKNPVARWAAGFDKFSELSDYALPHEVGLDANGNPVKGFAKFTNPLDYLRGLDRPSKANNLLHNSIDGINQTMSMVEDFDGQVNQVFKLMDVTPQQTVDGLKATNLPIYAGSAEFQHVPTILKDLKPKVLDLQSQYHSFDGDRQVLTKIAEALGVEPYKLVNELHNSADGDVRYRQFIDTLAEKAATENGLDINEFRKQLKNAQTPDAIAGIIPKGASGDLLRAILTDDSLKALSGKKLKIMADKFVGENAPGIGLTEDMAKARLQILLEDGIGAAAAKYFGVKPSNAAMRMSYLVKKAQGIALLGQNPTNFVNNALNNYITIGWDMGIGALFGTSMKDIDEFNQRTGAVSSRNKEGGLVVGETAFEPLNSQISKARKGTDWIQGATDIAAKAGKNPLIAPFTKLSMNAEVNARKLAAYHGASEYINRMWVAGKGFTKVEAFDPSLKKLLDSAGVSIERFNKAIEGSRNNAEMTQRVADLLGGMEKPTVYDAWTPDEIELMRKSNVEAFNSLEKAVSDGDIDGAKKIYQDSILKAIRDQLEEDTFNTVHNAMLTGSAGGARGLSDFLTTMFARKADQLFHHRDFTAAMAEKARGAPDYESRAAIWREADRQANAEWGAYKQEESKQFLGLLCGMGVLDDIESGTMKLVGDIQLNEDAFYFSRSELFDTHTLTKFATDAERAADFERITQQLNGEYTDMLIEESHLQIELDNQLRDRFISTVTSPVEAKILGAQFDIWQGAKQQIRQKMGQQELLFRTGEVPANILNEFGDLVPPEIKARILQLRNLGDKETYYNEIYRAGISEMTETNNRLSPGRTQITPDKAPEVEAAAKPYQEQASQEMTRSEIRKVAHDVANTARELAHRAPLDSMDRTAFAQGLRTAYNLDDAQLKQVMVFQDAIAKYMAEQKGVTPDDIFKAGFAEISKGTGGIEQAGKGSVDFLSDGRAVLKGLEAADISTAIHETGHVWLRTAPDADKAVITRWLKDEYGKDLQPDWMMQEFAGNADLVDAHEKFARAMERYFTEGITPPKASKRLLAAFDRIKEWMTQIYREITGSQIDVKINPEMRAMLDMWMTGKRVELDAVKVVGERAAEMVDPKTPEWAPEYSPDVQQGIQDWKDNKIYIDGSGNYRYAPDRKGLHPELQDVAKKIVPYNKALKKAFPKHTDMSDAIHGKAIPDPTPEVKAEVQRVKAEAKLLVSPDDIPFDVAQRAHSGSSFYPEERARSEQAQYVRHIQDVESTYSKLANTPEKQSKLQDLLTEYKNEYAKRLTNYLRGESGIVSSMIAGPSNFPVERMAKRNEASAKRLSEFIDWSERAQRKIKSEMIGTKAISSDNPEAINLLQAKLSKKQELQSFMVEANKIVRKKGLSDDEKVAQIVALGHVTEDTARKVLEPDFAGRLGFPDYATKNNNTEIRRLQERISSLQSEATRPVSSDMLFDGGRITENKEENRIQIVFDDKPDEATISKLKSSGFKWAPSQNAWQRQLTDNARYAVKQLFPDAKAQEGASDFVPPINEQSGQSLFQTPDWTPETLTNYVNLLIKNNDPATLLQAIREEPIANRAKLLDAVGRQAPELASPVWRAMDKTGELYSDRISGYTRSLLQEMKPGEKLDGQSVPVGTVDSLSDMPKGHGMQEMYTAHIRPTLDKLDNLKNFKATPGVNVDPKLKAGITSYLDNVRQERADVNMGAIRHGEIKADFAMLNYGKQANWDNLLNVAMPYHFWYSRSIGNWGLRAIEKPKIYADYLRLQNFANNQTQEREGFPTRLKGKVGMHLSFLPEGFQDIYIDPNRQLFPFTQMVKPWEEYLTDQNRENKRAQTILQDMVDNGELEQADADTALQTMQGDNWNKAVSQARVELESDTSNPLDFAQTISGFSMPLSVLIAQASGRTDKLGMLPATRILRNITAAAGYDNYKGLDLSIKGLGGDAYQEGRIRSMLANMVANSEITLDEFNNALLTNSGGAYTKATQKVAYMNLAKTAVPGIGLDFYPEGEQKARAAQESYKSEAIPAFESGDTEAKRNFFEANPGLSARYTSFEDDPVKMRNKLLTNEVWDAYNKMPELYQKQAREQLGTVFQDWMATKSTMSDSMLAGWAQAMGKMLPKEIDAANTPVKFAPPEAAKKVQSFYDAKKKAFPWSEQAWKDYYALPENSPQRTAMMNNKQFQQMFAWENAYKANHSDIIPYMVDSNDELFGVDPKIAAQVYAYQAEKYGKFPGKDDPNFSKWNNAYLAKHPDIVPFVIGKDNELKQLPKNVQSYVYQYRANRDQLFPGLLDNWDAAPQATKSKYLAWQKQIAGAFPEAAPYIVSDNTIRKGLGQPTLPYNPISMNDMSNELRGQYQDYIYSGTPITTGGLMELERLWKDAGKPEGNMQKYIDSLR